MSNLVFIQRKVKPEHWIIVQNKICKGSKISKTVFIFVSSSPNDRQKVDNGNGIFSFIALKMWWKYPLKLCKLYFFPHFFIITAQAGLCKNYERISILDGKNACEFPDEIYAIPPEMNKTDIYVLSNSENAFAILSYRGSQGSKKNNLLFCWSTFEGSFLYFHE